jgi:WD40 repeat protein
MTVKFILMPDHITFSRISIFYILGILYSLTAGCKPAIPLTAQSPGILVVQNKELIPEGIEVHPQSGTIYLSSLHQNKIVAVDKQGNCKDLISTGQNGFMRGLGIKISNDRKTLWACSASLDSARSTSGLFQIELASGKVIYSLLFNSDSASLFNDLVIHSNGDIYLTDTYQSTVFRFNAISKSLEPWLKSEQLSFANGITFSPDEKVLFVASGNRGIQRIDVETKQITPVTKGNRTDYAIDGLLFHNKSLIGVIGWPQDQPTAHRVIRYHLSEDSYMTSVDTLAIDKSYLLAPTTAVVFRNRLFFLGKTNLGLYNQGKQSLAPVKDSLEFPLVVQIPL